MISINGKTYRGSTVVVTNGVVFVDGKRVQDKDLPRDITTLVVNGDIESLQTDASVNCNDVGTLNAGGSVNCDDVLGNLSAGGSVHCDSVSGNVIAGGSVVH